ncbi:MAG: nuclear transport factor 2 family protein [Propionibacteriaceae bacterium]|jgi:hypothetical protein|nr:nuclear transport factor 2 family protein [Propionibacteriaceae bacterium]
MNEQDIKDIEQREELLYAALTASDAVGLGELLADDFQDTHFAGLVAKKGPYLTGHRDRVFRCGLIERVSGYTWTNGQVGITAGHITVAPHPAKPGDPLTLMQTIIWVKQGNWKVLVRQTTKGEVVPVAPCLPELAPGTGTPQDVEAAELAFYGTQVSNDVAKMGGLLSNSLSWFAHAGGYLDSKASYIQAVAAAKYAHAGIWKLGGKTQVFGNAAVSVGTIDMDCMPADHFRFSMRVDYVLLWALEADGWKMIARHGTRQPL